MTVKVLLPGATQGIVKLEMTMAEAGEIVHAINRSAIHARDGEILAGLVEALNTRPPTEIETEVEL
jgi:hypothetical protein